MDKSELQKLNEAAWLKWGKDTQLRMAIEECAELIVAIAKFGRKINGTNHIDIAMEIADIEICISQIKQMLDIEAEVQNHKEFKYKRLQKYINSEA